MSIGGYHQGGGKSPAIPVGDMVNGGRYTCLDRTGHRYIAMWDGYDLIVGTSRFPHVDNDRRGVGLLPVDLTELEHVNQPTEQTEERKPLATLSQKLHELDLTATERTPCKE